MAEAILKLLGGLIGWLAAKALDKVFGKYLAMIVIAFEKEASREARLEFNDSMNKMAENMGQKYQDWEEWRKRSHLLMVTVEAPK